MAYIPKGARWYLAEMVEEITIADEPQNVVHVDLVLVRADSPEEAYERAMMLGHESDISYENSDGRLVTVTFHGLRNLHVIHDDLEHGAELIYEEAIGLSSEQVAQLVRPKAQLNVFRPPAPRQVPNYVSKEMIEEWKPRERRQEVTSVLPARSPAREEHAMISRVWHGWTTPANADAYEALLKEEIFPGIQSRQIAGYRGIQLLRRDLADEVEFVTIMRFDSLDAVRAFAGEEYEVAVVPPKARAVLERFDARSQHYEVRVDLPA